MSTNSNSSVERDPAAAGDASARAVRKRGRRGRVLIIAGSVLVVLALAVVGLSMWDAHRAERNTGALLEQVEAFIPLPDAIHIIDPNYEMPTVVVDDRRYIGVLEVPALGLRLPVQTSWSYLDLRISPCRYAGSAYSDDLVITANSYPAHFGYLSELACGDAVVFTDVDGNVFNYEVVAVDALSSSDVELMTEADGWDLTLFTNALGSTSQTTIRCARQ